MNRLWRVEHCSQTSGGMSVSGTLECAFVFSTLEGETVHRSPRCTIPLQGGILTRTHSGGGERGPFIGVIRALRRANDQKNACNQSTVLQYYSALCCIQ